MLDIKFSVVKGDDVGTAIEKSITSVSDHNRLLLCGHPDVQKRLVNLASHDQRPIEIILKASFSLDIAESFLDDRIYLENTLSDFDLEELEGTWPALKKNHQQSALSGVLTDSLKRHQNELLVAKLWVGHSSDVLAHFKYGNWNCCPKTEIHCAIWRYWQKMYGAYIIFVNHDIIWAKVDNPPSNKKQAIELAWEHYYYCRDSVDQGTDTIQNLAASLLNKNVWFFWWD